MLKNLKKYFKYNKPFYGVNCGSYGFLMNNSNIKHLEKRISKSKINKFSCTFLDENLEIEYENSEWTKDRKKILVKISFFILFSI